MAATTHKDIQHFFGPARDQGERPTCLSFAVSDAHAALRGAWEPLSCEFLFYHAQCRGNRPPTVGSTLPDTLSALRNEGQPYEESWPYLETLPHDTAAWCPPAGIQEIFRRRGQEGDPAVGAIVDEIENERPPIVLMYLSQSFFFAGPDGIVDPPRTEAPERSQRHAVVAVAHGEVNGQRAILIRNSWGDGWAANGHAWLTESFLEPRVFRVAVLTEEVDVSAHRNAA